MHFEAFRTLEQRRIDAGNAIWAILAGSKIASNTLNLTEGSTRTLAEMFPTVEHIERFNLRSDIARSLLGDAEADLCTMGMSYAIALHEDFVKTCLGWLLPLGLVTRSQLRDAKTFNVHEKIEAASGVAMDVDALALFHLTRLMRNCHIHAGGLGSKELERYTTGMTPTQIAGWEELTKRPFQVLVEGTPVEVGVGELIATLAIGKRLSYDVNLALQSAIPRDEWANMAAKEYFALGAKSPSHNSALRSLVGYTRGTYSALALTADELSAAIERLR
ncbi:hypothetical protein [Nocardioides panaciterrulae]|uniref:Uncharacterized protein n=1 Tax=Nocardioides panaciterrulae TaxID=661492 RepID=A0A7Y9JBB3_9ACTN|nr:hypothetical protein [Nocardioides panaciterrulae]NYD42218.1 hypothetical protein [Nocardioides panaciterrulae]